VLVVAHPDDRSGVQRGKPFGVNPGTIHRADQGDEFGIPRQAVPVFIPGIVVHVSGCGNGVQALLTARYSDRVIAVDTNPRALRFTAFNAQLNGFNNVECRQGSLFDPVEGMLFDLIVCNPPFVISSESRFQFPDRWMHYYRDLGIEGISSGGIILRRRPDSSNWMRYDELPKDAGAGSSEFITGIFEAQDYLAELENYLDLLDEAFFLAEPIQADHSFSVSGGQFMTHKIRLRKRSLEITCRR
jgi:SAM-dependent methyltransferase